MIILEYSFLKSSLYSKFTVKIFEFFPVNCWNITFEIWNLRFGIWNSIFEIWTWNFEIWNLTEYDIFSTFFSFLLKVINGPNRGRVILEESLVPILHCILHSRISIHTSVCWSARAFGQPPSTSHSPLSILHSPLTNLFEHHSKPTTQIENWNGP